MTILPALALVAALEVAERSFGSPIAFRCRRVRGFEEITGVGGTITMDGGGVGAGEDAGELDESDEEPEARSSGVSASGSTSIISPARAKLRERFAPFSELSRYGPDDSSYVRFGDRCIRKDNFVGPDGTLSGFDPDEL